MEKSTEIEEYLDGCMSEFVEDLRQFFLHERDQELGRWRVPSMSGVVVYPRESPGVFDVVDESRAVSYRVKPGDTEASFTVRHAVEEYRAAHPVPKPWHDAQTGEVWVLQIDHLGVAQEYGGEVACYLDERGDFLAVKGLMRIDARDAQITAGHRIWPEVS